MVLCSGEVRESDDSNGSSEVLMEECNLRILMLCN